MTQRSNDEELFGCEGIRGLSSDTNQGSTYSDRQSAKDDIELGLAPPITTYLAPPPELYRGSLGSVGMVSVYMYDQNEGDGTSGGIRYMGARL